ncbi:2,3-dihydroxybenzoate-AMP ligase [Saccharopolyspora kobensis]|uniref:2,3-dihydroxybenzoate-AMP ligase n=1 Tax=Saccharopolyspora kobensis TaxID=146035 RepID=A0A1H6A4B2_9PSEU|nr:AMP-binding protein [Saccharopolyspora kobensis]SEG43573.1 2,3-dihydroxybenzoate-AMP ligase [Saccharopolyspora kobensis]SFE19686.1 2,3-dihydroxybenzoate-AMP ligase [Saccharopolyspora kobensis]
MLDGFVPWPPDFAERYRRAGYWSGSSLGQLLAERAGHHPDKIAAVDATRRVSYAELVAESDRIASGLLGLGIGHRDRVVLHLPNAIEFLSTIFALFKIGAIPVLALPGHRRDEILHLARASDAVAYIAQDRAQGFDYRTLAREVLGDAPSLKHVVIVGEAEEFTPLAEIARSDVRELPPVDSSEVALLLLSGGTTGVPKLIPRTHDDYAYNIFACARAVELDGNGVYLAANPVPHNAALGCPGALGALLLGGKAVLAANPSPDHVFPLIEREGVTHTALVPALALLWAETAQFMPVDMTGMTVQVGSSKFSAGAAERVSKSLGCRILNVFGIGEGLITSTHPDDPPEIAFHTEGKPICPDDEIRIVDAEDNEVGVGVTGELLTRGPYTIRGYFAAPEHNSRAFTSDGFFRTGDLARMTEDGNIVIEGRLKDIIHHAGEKVSAEEVEGHVLTHPMVRDTAVVGIPDEARDERLCVFVVLSSDAEAAGEPITLRMIRDHIRDRGMATYKLPDQLIVVPDLPRTPIGKIDKKALRAGQLQHS